MGNQKVLRMRYKPPNFLDIVVDDIDKSTILDIFEDLIKGSEKHGFVLPEHPKLLYVHNSQSMKLDDDNDLMMMFHLKKDTDLFNVAIGSAEIPCMNLVLARGLVESKLSTSEVPRSSIGVPISLSKSSHGTTEVSHCNNRKVPASTARRKGLSVSSGNLSRTKVLSSSGDGENIEVGEPSEYIVGVEANNSSEVGNDDDDDDESDDFDVDDIDVGEKQYMDKMYANGEMYDDRIVGKIKLKTWKIFVDKVHFTSVLRDFCIQEGFDIIVIKSDLVRYSADSECKWRIHASILPDKMTWAIKTLSGKRSCARLDGHNAQATPEWAAEKIAGFVRANPQIQGKAVNTLLFENYGVKLKSTSLYKAISIAKNKSKGDEDKSYGYLPAYCEVVKMTNPGSMAHCVWKVAEDEPEKPIQFKSIFISLKPMIEGFMRGCRGLIGVDGCHLKGKYGGVVLSAIALDGNNEIFPIAYGIYENECKETWSQFFYPLKNCLKESKIERGSFTIISDRQKGVEPALKDVWPDPSRRFCCRHLCSNFKKEYPGKLMHILFWACCKSYSEFTFTKAIDKLTKVAKSNGPLNWLKDAGSMECWARHKYDPLLCSPETTSNFVESFNSTLGVDRCNPVLSLLEGNNV